MILFNPAILEKPLSPSSAKEVAHGLAQLAGFLMSDRALSMAGMDSTHRPKIPAEVGCCWPLIGIRDSRWREYLLPGIILPLRWTNHSKDDQRLPPEVVQCARNVRHQLLPNHSAEMISIGFDDRESEWPDLKQLDSKQITAASCFASLAGGLESYLQDVPPDPNIWASAVWNGEFKTVELLSEKLAATNHWNVSTVYVAPGQSRVNESNETRDGPKVRMKELGRGIERGPRQALSRYFADLALEPDSGDWEACRHYHDVIRRYDRSEGDKYYDRILVRHILRRCRSNIRLASSIVNPVNISHFITIATQQTQPIRVIAGAFNVKNVLVLFTTGPSNMKQVAESACDQIRQLFGDDFKAKPEPFHYDPDSDRFPICFLSELSDKVMAFTEGVNDEQVVFDIDRGLTLHKLALSNHIIRPDNLICSLYHQSRRGNLIEHGTERILLWKGKDDWTTPFGRPEDVDLCQAFGSLAADGQEHISHG